MWLNTINWRATVFNETVNGDSVSRNADQYFRFGGTYWGDGYPDAGGYRTGWYKIDGGGGIDMLTVHPTYGFQYTVIKLESLKNIEYIDASNIPGGAPVYFRNYLDLKNDNKIIGIFNIEGFYGDEYANTFIGSDFAEKIVGNGGSDNIDGGGGNDIIYGGFTESNYNIPQYLYNWQDDNDIIHGGAGDDTIYGQQGNDILYGDEGNDTIDGGDGNDKLYGGDGDDTFISDGNDIIDGGTGVNKVIFVKPNSNVYVNLNTSDYLNISNVDAGTGDDQLAGNGLDNVLNGKAGNDSISGNGGNDKLYGDAGNDTLTGGSGDDLLDGRTGTDTASYADATSGVRVDLSNTAAQDTGGAGTDTLVSIENLTG